MCPGNVKGNYPGHYMIELLSRELLHKFLQHSLTQSHIPKWGFAAGKNILIIWLTKFLVNSIKEIVTCIKIVYCTSRDEKVLKFSFYSL